MYPAMADRNSCHSAELEKVNGTKCDVTCQPYIITHSILAPTTVSFFDQLAFFSTDTHSYTCTRISFQLSTSYSVKVLQKICNKESLFLYARNHFKCSYTCIITAYYDLWLDIHTKWPSLAERLLHKTLKELTNDLNYYSNKNTHTRLFNGPFSGTTWVSRYQKGNTNLDFTEARDSEWQWHQLGHMQVCTSLQTDNHTSTPSLSFLQAGCPSCRPTNSFKALKVIKINIKIKYKYSWCCFCYNITNFFC